MEAGSWQGATATAFLTICQTSDVATVPPRASVSPPYTDRVDMMISKSCHYKMVALHETWQAGPQRAKHTVTDDPTPPRGAGPGPHRSTHTRVCSSTSHTAKAGATQGPGWAAMRATCGGRAGLQEGRNLEQATAWGSFRTRRSRAGPRCVKGPAPANPQRPRQGRGCRGWEAGGAAVEGTGLLWGDETQGGCGHTHL